VCYSVYFIYLCLSIIRSFTSGYRPHTAPIRRWIRDRLYLLRAEDSSEEQARSWSSPRIVLELLLLLLFTVLDYVRAAYQILVSGCLRSLWPPAAQRNDDRGRRNNNDCGRHRSNSVPELEDCSNNNADPLSSVTTVQPLVVPPPNSTQHNSDRGAEARSSTIDDWDWGPVPIELEPAFLEERQYPNNANDCWMVYHPKLRVVTRQEAERYDRDEMVKRAKEQSPREQTDEMNNNSHCDAALFEDEKKDDPSAASSNKDDTTAADTTTAHKEEPKSVGGSSSPKRRANTNNTRQAQRERSPDQSNIPLFRPVVAT